MHRVESFFAFHPHANRLFHQATFMTNLCYPPTHPNFPSAGVLHAMCAVGSQYTAVISQTETPGKGLMPASKLIPASDIVRRSLSFQTKPFRTSGKGRTTRIASPRRTSSFPDMPTNVILYADIACWRACKVLPALLNDMHIHLIMLIASILCAYWYWSNGKWVEVRSLPSARVSCSLIVPTIRSF